MATDYNKCSIGVALGNVIDTITTAMSIFGNMLRFVWLRPPARRVLQPRNMKIGKEHRGTYHPRLVDALCDMLIKLKEVGVI